MKSFKKDWKLYSLKINDFQIIPAYYDYIRYYKNISKFFKKHFNIFQFKNIWNKYKSYFDNQNEDFNENESNFNIKVRKLLKLNVLSD